MNIFKERVKRVFLSRFIVFSETTSTIERQKEQSKQWMPNNEPSPKHLNTYSSLGKDCFAKGEIITENANILKTNYIKRKLLFIKNTQHLALRQLAKYDKLKWTTNFLSKWPYILKLRILTWCFLFKVIYLYEPCHTKWSPYVRLQISSLDVNFLLFN